MDDAQMGANTRSQAVDLIAGTTIAGGLYALVVALYCLLTRLSYSQLWSPNGKIKRQTFLTLTVASSMIICATMDVTLSNIQRKIAYVDYNTLPGGPLGIPASLHATTVIELRLVARLVEKFLITGVMIWRVLILWSETPLLKPITLLLYVTNAGLAIVDLIMEWPGSGRLVTSVAAPRIEQRMFITSITFSTTILVFMTLMLVIRLLSARWQHIKSMGKSETSDQYLSIAAILIESYALETAWNIAFCIFCSLKFVPVDNFFDATITQVDVLTNFLVIYRVASGRAWDKQTHGRLSTLRWNHPDQSGVTIGTINA